ncbi:MAG: prepilin-type N-terminal cleavage/methylation domain-containing protein, partial [Candidatus Omnitrophota bacterium]
MERLSFFFFLSFFSKRRKSAFTLIELLLVVALMVVIAGLSIPNLPRHLSVFQLDQTTRHVSYLMRYAQSLAVVNQKEYRLCFSLDRLKYWLEEESADKEA